MLKKKKVGGKKRRAALTSVFAGAEDEAEDQSLSVADQLKANAEAIRRRAEAEEARTASTNAELNAFSYDEVYDTLKPSDPAAALADASGADSAAATVAGPPQAKYIANMLKHAQERSQLGELAQERRRVEERKEEDHLYADKAKYMTSGFRKKLEERQAFKAALDAQDSRIEATSISGKKKSLSSSSFVSPAAVATSAMSQPSSSSSSSSRLSASSSTSNGSERGNSDAPRPRQQQQQQRQPSLQSPKEEEDPKKAALKRQQALFLQSVARRNTEADIESARERYFARKQTASGEY